MKASTYRKTSALIYKPFMVVNVTVDICKFNKGLVRHPWFDLFLEDLKKYSNLLHPCPFKVSFFIIRNEEITKRI